VAVIVTILPFVPLLMLRAAVIIPCSIKMVFHVVWCFCYYCDAGLAAVITFLLWIMVAADVSFVC
jgi:hypothetical protein